MAAKTQKLTIAQINLKARLAPALPLSIWVGSNPAPYGTLYANSPEILGILEEISGLGFEMGEVLPSEKNGTIRLNVARGTIDFNKRLYDYLETHTIADQIIEIYSFSKEPDKIGDEDDLELEFSGWMESAYIKPDANSMLISIKSEKLSTASILKKITNLIFPNANQAAIGRDLPLILGAAQEVNAQMISDIDNSPTYAYGTTLNGDTFKNDVPSNYYLKSGDKYKEVYFTTDETTPVIESAEDTGGSEYIMLGRYQQYDFSIAMPIADVVWPQPYLITAIDLRVAGVVTFPVLIDPDPNFLVNYDEPCFLQIDFLSTKRVVGGYAPDKVLGGEIFDLYNYRNHLKTRNFDWQRFNFSAPIYLEDNGCPIYISLRCTGGMNYTGIAIKKALNQTGVRYIKGSVMYNYENDRLDWTLEAEDVVQLMLPHFREIACKMYGVAIEQISPPTADNNNLSYSSFRLKQVEYTSSPNQADISSITDIAVKTDGLLDDDTGTITGTPNKLITNGVDVIKLLYYFQNGSSLSGLDVSTFSPASYIKNVSGSLTRSVSIRNLIAEILNNLRSKLLPTRGGDFALWTYGIRQTSVATIYESDFNIERIDIEGLDSLINSVSCLYNKSILNSGVQELQTGKEVGFLGAYEEQDTGSIGIYGQRDLNINSEELNFINDEEAAALWTQYKLRLYALERFTITGSLPFWKNNYRAIELNDVIDFSHIDSPSVYGSAPSTLEPPITTDKTSKGSDINLGFLFRRAKRYKMRVLKRDPKISTTGESVIVLKLQVLNNPREII